MHAAQVELVPPQTRGGQEEAAELAQLRSTAQMGMSGKSQAQKLKRLGSA